MIEITDAVKDRIMKILEKNPGKYLRIAVEGDGCAGPYLSLSLDEARDNEIFTRVNGIDILVSDYVKKVAEVSTINIFVNNLSKDLI
jgi:Fe-S cluster assembly iron-binding protein IscA